MQLGQDVVGWLPRHPAPGHGEEAMHTRDEGFWIAPVKRQRSRLCFPPPSDALIPGSEEHSFLYQGPHHLVHIRMDPIPKTGTKFSSQRGQMIRPERL